MEKGFGLRESLWGAAVLALGAGLLLWGEQVSAAVGDSVRYCLTALLPALFPFMALTACAVRSGAGGVLGRLLGGLCQRLLRLPRCCALPVLMSLVGGYPAGAKSAALLLERGEIDREQAGRMLLFCVGPGPAFVVSFIGGLLGSPALGWLLLGSVSLAALFLGLLAAVGAPKPRSPGAASPVNRGGVLIPAVGDAAGGMLGLCACVVLFAGLNALLHACGLFQALCRGLARSLPLSAPQTAALLSFLLEITGGVGAAAELGAGPVLYAFGLGFGGLCVHLQLFSQFPDFPQRPGRFFLFRLLHGLLAAGLCRLGLILFPAVAAAAYPAEPGAAAVFSASPAGGLALFLLCGFFLLCTGQPQARDCARP